MNTKGIKKILFLIIILISLSSCNKKINKYKQLNEIAYSDILLQKEDRYLVYIMSNTCKACEDIKNDIFSYANKAKTNSELPPIYYINISNVSKNNGLVTEDDSSYEYFVGTTNYTDIKITATPALIIITNGKVVITLISSTSLISPGFTISNIAATAAHKVTAAKMIHKSKFLIFFVFSILVLLF